MQKSGKKVSDFEYLRLLYMSNLQAIPPFWSSKPIRNFLIAVTALADHNNCHQHNHCFASRRDVIEQDSERTKVSPIFSRFLAVLNF